MVMPTSPLRMRTKLGELAFVHTFQTFVEGLAAFPAMDVTVGSLADTDESEGMLSEGWWNQSNSANERQPSYGLIGELKKIPPRMFGLDFDEDLGRPCDVIGQLIAVDERDIRAEPSEITERLLGKSGVGLPNIVQI